MTKDFVKIFKEEINVSNEKAKETLRGLGISFKKFFAQGNQKITITGLGVFLVKSLEPRKVVDLQNGEKVMKSIHVKVLRFKPSKKVLAGIKSDSNR
jgi:nucleoid DNA-binding protein